MRTIENLVFKGGGILGAAYISAFDELQMLLNLPFPGSKFLIFNIRQ